MKKKPYALMKRKNAKQLKQALIYIPDVAVALSRFPVEDDPVMLQPTAESAASGPIPAVAMRKRSGKPQRQSARPQRAILHAPKEELPHVPRTKADVRKTSEPQMMPEESGKTQERIALSKAWKSAFRRLASIQGGPIVRTSAFIPNRQLQAGSKRPPSGASGKSGLTGWSQLVGNLLESNTYEGTVLIPPTRDWNTPQQGRPQQWAQAFARAGLLTFYMTPNERYDDYREGILEIAPRLYVTNVPMRAFASAKHPIVMFNHPTSISGIAELNNPSVVYDYVDGSAVAMLDAYTEHAHRFLTSGASVVIAADDNLLRDARLNRPDAVLCPDGIDYDFFRQMTYRQGLIPDDLYPILFKNRPVIGYFGAMAAWVDYELIARVAAMRPGYQFVLIGPDVDGSLQEAASMLGNNPNIFYLGAKPYACLANYVPFFDVGIIPFRVNEGTSSAFPLKMYEYMAAGRPVVTTDLPKCARHPYVMAAQHAAQFVAHLDEALRLNADSSFCERLREYAQQHTWDARIAFMRDMLKRKNAVQTAAK